MHVYVAGASTEFRRVANFVLEVTGTGWTVSHPWWVEFENQGEAFGSLEAREGRMIRDFLGLKSASLFILLCPSEGHATKNAWIELGIMLGMSAVLDANVPRIWVVGEPEEERFFSLKAERHFATEGECLSALAHGV